MPLAPSVKLTSNELDSALAYIEAAGASDFFPRPFEFSAIRQSWNKVRSVLEGVELLSYSPRSALEMIVPKQRCLVRPAHLLDPIDAIVYGGLVLRIAPAIQDNRNKYQVQRIFSWHFNPIGTGADIFESDWDGYQAKARELCLSYSFVATADVVDFYPRIYLHRLENAISSA
ncbi:MAG TPA: reverse transcriptase, partial [Blastocatellia bacterium]